MDQCIFAYYVGKDRSYLEWNVCASSIRTFGGRYANAPIYVFTCTPKKSIPSDVIEEFRVLRVKLIIFDLPTRIPDDIFGDFVYAAQKAESMCRNKTQLMVWLGWNTIILNEPKAFQIAPNTTIGYCPVHHTNIGSILSQPIDEFWTRIYDICGVNEKKIFPMRTQMDDNILRPYFNAGSLIIRPQNRLFQRWWRIFRQYMSDPSIIPFFQSNIRYKIFFHQAILSGVILAEYPREALEELPSVYNFPLNLYENAPLHRRTQNLGELITVRFEEDNNLALIAEIEPVARWLQKYRTN